MISIFFLLKKYFLYKDEISNLFENDVAARISAAGLGGSMISNYLFILFNLYKKKKVHSNSKRVYEFIEWFQKNKKEWNIKIIENGSSISTLTF